MAETPEDFALHRFVQDLFEDLTLTLPALGCRFEGVVTANSMTVRGRPLLLKNQLFLLFADLANGQSTLAVRFRPSSSGDGLWLGFVCEPFVPEAAERLSTWVPEVFETFRSAEGQGFRLSLPLGDPLDIGPPIDWHRLAQMYGGAAYGRQVLDHFLQRVETLLGDLRKSVDAHDSAAVLRSAHTLKGAARGVTADAVAEAALRLEMLGRSGDLAPAPDLYKALLETYDDFIDWLQEGPRP